MHAHTAAELKNNRKKHLLLSSKEDVCLTQNGKEVAKLRTVLICLGIDLSFPQVRYLGCAAPKIEKHLEPRMGRVHNFFTRP